MESLQQLITQLTHEEEGYDKQKDYSLLLELFLSIDDGICAEEVTLKDAFSRFHYFASTRMMTDLTCEGDGKGCHEIILQIIALCFSHVNQWDEESRFCLDTMLSNVCEVLLTVELSALESNSFEEKSTITALFSLDNSFKDLKFKHQQDLLSAFNHILDSKNENALARTYGYKALTQYLKDIGNSSETLSTLTVPFLRDFTNTAVNVRKESLSCIATLPCTLLKDLPFYSEGEVKRVLQFLR